MSWLRSLLGGGGAAAGQDGPSTPEVRPRSLSVEETHTRYRESVCKDSIDLAALRQLAVVGIPEELRVRGQYWKLLLGYLPTERASWDEILLHHQAQYQRYLDQYFTEEMHTTHALLRERRKRWVTADDGGAPAEPDSEELKRVIADCELELEIRRDVARTYSGMHFFRMPSDPSFTVSTAAGCRGDLSLPPRDFPAVRLVLADRRRLWSAGGHRHSASR